MAEEYVIMPKSDYVSACDAIRRKTGKTDVIKSGDLSAEIDCIEGSGSGEIPNSDNIFIYVSKDMNDWDKNAAAKDAFISIIHTEGKENVCKYKGVGGHEVIAYPVLLMEGKTYVFSLEYSSSSNLTGEYDLPYAPYIAFMDNTALNYTSNPYTSGKALSSSIITTEATNGYVLYSCEYESNSRMTAYVGLVLGCTLDGVDVEFSLRNISLEMKK